MEKQARTIMQEDIVSGFTVSSRGEASKMIKRSAGGGAGNLAAEMTKQTVQTPQGHSGPMYIALGLTKLYIFSVKQGFFKNSIGELIFDCPKNQVQSLNIDNKFIPEVDIVLSDGTQYAFECGKRELKSAKKIKSELGA